MPAPPFLPSAFSMVPSVMLMVTAPFLVSLLPLPMPAPPYLPPVASVMVPPLILISVSLRRWSRSRCLRR